MGINAYPKDTIDKSDAILLLLSVCVRDISPYFTIICFIILIVKNHIRFPNCLIWIFICFVFFFANSQSTGLVTTNNVIWYSVPSLLALFIGYNYAYKYSYRHSMLVLLFMMSLSLALPNILITLYDVYNVGIINPVRNLTTLGDTQRSITGRTIELTLAIAGISLIYFYKKTESKRVIKNFLILAIVAEICTLHYVSRTGVAILLISLIIGYLYVFRIRNIIKLAFVVLILFFIYKCLIEGSILFNIFADREIEGSNIYDVGGRSERWEIGFNHLIENPLGFGTDFRWYAHNFWLDFGREGGLIPFFLLSLFSVYVIIRTVKLQAFKRIPSYLRFCLLLFIIIINIAFFTEPVHSGSPISMYFYFMLSGIVLGLYKQKKVLCG